MDRRISLFALTLVLASTLAPPSALAMEDGDPPAHAEAERAFLALKADALGYAHEGPQDPLAHLDARVLNSTRVPADDLRAAWRDAANASRSQARSRVLQAEAALLDLAARNALAAHDAGEPGEARAWLQIVLVRVPWEARGLPAAPLLEGNRTLEREPLTEVLHAALAQRAREEVVASVLLAYGDHPAAADATAEGAAALVRTLVPDATARLPPTRRAVLEENATGYRDELADHLPALQDRTDHWLPGLLAPLASLEYDRDVEPLDEFGLRNVDGAFAAARAAREDPDLMPVLRDQALLQYAADRGKLIIMGEGDIEPADEAFLDLNGTVDARVLEDAAHRAFDALRPVALLERGVVVKVETGGVQPDRVHRYRVTLVRPSLEGVASYELVLDHDPAIVEIVDATPLALTEGFTFEAVGGTVTLSGSADPPLNRSAHVAHLHLEARGKPETRTSINVTSATFLEADGDALPVFRLRDGGATVANITYRDDGGDDVDEVGDDGGLPVPSPHVAAAAALALAGLIGRRRWHRR